MRWLFLLLLVLNIFYAVWHQQEVPARAKELAPMSVQKGEKRDIQLLSESPAEPGQARQCLYVGGYATRAQASALQARLGQMGAQGTLAAETGSFWVKVDPGSRAQLSDSALANLSSEFNDLKRKIMRCEGIATVE